ncbi:MAG: 30S ribosomal protein S20 [Actinobacteria bacterium]|nr:MAG: 30S ribosomal protein S20 [Actinomycetota bacterium]
MANIKSQIKRNSQNEARRLRNKAVRSELKTREKSAMAAAEAGDAERAGELVKIAQRKLDSAASRGVIHRNTAARRKARLTKRVNALVG